MKRWHLWIVLLYALTLIALAMFLCSGAVLGAKGKIDSFRLITAWPSWVVLGVLALNQWALLLLPVDLANKRPAGKRSLFFQVAAASFSAGLLIAGLALAVSEVITNGDSIDHMDWIFFGALGISWFFWAFIFTRWSRKLEPEGLIRRLRQTLFRGSVLQLLVVVPCHIYARSKTYCCAGYETAIGLALGLAVMLVSFGPGILFLYVDQLKKARPVPRGGQTLEGRLRE